MFSRGEEQRDGQVLDVLTDETNGLRIAVSRFGAELVSIQKRDHAGNWTGFLYRDNDLTAPASGWANHATVMGYYLHRLKDGHSFYRGHEIKGGNHSFLRTKIWHAIDSADDQLKYRITPADFSATDYPLRVSLDLIYQLDNGQLIVRFEFTNNEPELVAHVEFGLHPGFAARSFESFQFRMPAGKYRRHFSPGNLLSGETEDIDFAGGEMPFPREQLAGSFILELLDVPKREFVFNDQASGRSISLDLSNVPYLTLWSDGGPFLCVEPCWGLTDHHKQRAFEDKEGIQTIPARGKLSTDFEMRLIFETRGTC
jgi:galactose mutarotase-like enzyme